MKQVVVSATSDLSTDQRLHRTSLALMKSGYDVLLVGRKKKSSAPLETKHYKTYRLKLFFENGFLFYAFFNVRLFFFLLFKKADLLFANDLDTLLPNYLVSKLKNIPLIYDSHEYYTETPELLNRPVVRGVWLSIEKFIFPKLKSVITVSDSIAELYQQKYKVEVQVVRNIPDTKSCMKIKPKIDFRIPEQNNILIYQGAGINVDRGLEELIEAMQFVDYATLLIVGDGDIIHFLKEKSVNLNLNSKIIFIEKVSPDELRTITPIADLAFSLDKDTNLNYRYSLPNKLFDYIHSNVPVLASSVTEVKNIIEKYQIGAIIKSHKPKDISDAINLILANQIQLNIWKENCLKAASQLNWENEEKILLQVISESGNDNQ